MKSYATTQHIPHDKPNSAPLSRKVDKFWPLAAGGHLETLQWLKTQMCPWNATTCAVAARYGHIEVLKWARGGWAGVCTWGKVGPVDNAGKLGDFTQMFQISSVSWYFSGVSQRFRAFSWHFSRHLG